MWWIEFKAWLTVWALWLSAVAPGAPKGPVEVPFAWPASAGGVRIVYLDSITSQSDLLHKHSLWGKLIDLAAGPGERRRTSLVRPFAAATDPEGRLIVADPGAAAVHIFDMVRKTHKFLQGPSRLRLKSPIGVDADASGNVYVSDSVLGCIFVFDSEGRFQRFIGEKKGEGYFRRPTGVAIDRATGRIYLTDTMAHKVYVLRSDGTIEREWGHRGSENTEFNYPVAVAVADRRVFVLDSMNFRVQVFSLDGGFLGTFGHAANEPGGFFRPKALAVDSRAKRVLVVDSMFEAVQAFSYDGRLQWVFGHGGSGPGEFSLPAGICLHPDGRILVADSYNRRIQLFRLTDSGARRENQVP